MEFELRLDNTIMEARRAVNVFAQELDFASADRVCRKTRSLDIGVRAARWVHAGTWTPERSKVVEEIFKEAIAAHEDYEQQIRSGAKEALPQEEQERVAGFKKRLIDRYKRLEKVFVHEYAPAL